MNEFQIHDIYTGLVTNTGIFAAVNIFLLWMMFRGINIAKDKGSNLVHKFFLRWHPVAYSSLTWARGAACHLT